MNIKNTVDQFLFENYEKIEQDRLNNLQFRWKTISDLLGVNLSSDYVRNRFRKIRQFKDSKVIKSDLPKRILAIDIETSFNICYSWSIGGKIRLGHDSILEERKIICISYSFLGEDKVYNIAWNNGDETKMLLKFGKVLENADILLGHNCVEVNTPILTSDLRWVPAGSLKEGDLLGGFEEGLKPGETLRAPSGVWKGLGQRDLQLSKVTNFETKMADCVKVILSNGDEVITTKDHYWLSMTSKDCNQRWKKSVNLKSGDKINKYFKVWEKEQSYDAGWLSGFISGEGSLGNYTEKSKGLSIQICQRPGVTWDKALNICDKLGIEYGKNRSPKTGGLGKQDTLYTNINGGKYKTLEYIGKLEIDRFIPKINWNKLGSLKGKDLEQVEVIDVIEVGQKEVAVFSTSSKTFFGAGYPMHNCDQFDIKFLRTRFAYHNIPFPKELETIDTLKMARKNFRFNSNKLDYIGQFLGLGQKQDTGGISLWKDIVLHNNKEALDKMISYCNGDVDLVKKVYEKLQEFHPEKKFPHFENDLNIKE